MARTNTMESTRIGHDDVHDLKAALRDGGMPVLDAAIADALSNKSRHHGFRISAGDAPATPCHMSVTGG